MKLRVKKEIILWDDYASEGEEEFTLKVGEEYVVRTFEEEQASSRFTLPDEVYTPEHHGWNQMAFDSEEDFWDFWEKVESGKEPKVL